MKRKNSNPAKRHNEASAAILMMYRSRRRIIRVLEILLRPLTWVLKTKPAPGLDQVKSILVFEAANLGDVVTFAPTLRSLRARFPKAHLVFLGKASTESFLQEQDLVDELIPIRVPWAEHRTRWKRYNPFSVLWPNFIWNLVCLRRRRFDLAFASGRSDIRHNFALWLTGALRRVGYAYGGGGFLLTDIVLPDLLHPHVSDLTLQFLKHLGIPIVRDVLLLRISVEDQNSADQILADHHVQPNDLLVGIHPGARTRIRQWGEDHFRDVANHLVERFGAKIVWFSDPAQPCSVPKNDNIIPISLPLRKFLAVLSRCRLFVCNDSGPMHMAGGLGVPVVAVFGPTQPEWFAPIGEGHSIVIRRDMWCRPCADRCIYEEPYCLESITTGQVLETAVRKIESLSLVNIAPLRQNDARYHPTAGG